ncbi:MAG TPA: alpha-L-fucosidase [Candidatus Hydrogenedentes bacterium]|nr:alpha-L-fucosidase [Candidatus Hydrogenedentota bacterium]HPC15045.1 alpha-L-fucosidase [Candidatus Hydrogenedentota bacterium]HRT19094.1 alpha-L-fucosidase [Candidatus Hydrogenedentota bacterium]HRT64023.1 alpha-L-fucosidase [Candidatus Hydrogenedentota bacterium]
MRMWLGLILMTAFAAMALNGGAVAEDRQPDRMQWWREARFGLFIHWGPVSLKGTEIGWSRGGERRGTGGAPGQIPVEVYDNLYKEFNPVEFNAREWVEIAKQAGMKYLVFTTRHHDGFSMFDTALSDYKITNSPFKRDVVAELAQACHEAGLRLGFYYSPPDWHHPDYRTENHARFLEYLHGQVRELCTNYGRLDIFWFDGLGGTVKDWDSEKLVAMIRRLQPDIIVNNRAGLPEDHDTPEQTVGTFQRSRPWETCMTIGDQWAWKPNDRVKSLKQCLDVLVRCAGGDGNLLFNVGPMPDGRIEGRMVSRLAEMGAWLKQYGETIYGTRGGPFKPGMWGASTCKGDKVYVHILDWKAVDSSWRLPKIDARIKEASMLTGGNVKVRRTPKGIRLDIPETARQDLDTIVVLTLDRPAFDVPPVAAVDPKSKAIGPSASNVFQNMPEYAAAMAFDDDPGSRWATDGGTHKAWLAVRLKKPATFAGVHIREACGSRVQSFAIEYMKNGTWISCYQGKTIGEDFRAAFAPVKAREFRLNILKATEGPTLFDFRLLPQEKRSSGGR